MWGCFPSLPIIARLRFLFLGEDTSKRAGRFTHGGATKEHKFLPHVFGRTRNRTEMFELWKGGEGVRKLLRQKGGGARKEDRETPRRSRVLLWSPARSLADGRKMETDGHVVNVSPQRGR
ncbi:hypothetical protein CEXT_7141 [Caerostris extrusa]|uniref:Uncharacterized protein n=1 Tax=Caerostris extrusa TaxID=172846 RepID=A0AAV4MY64_CAEEX|nr:hypothetical protein CEXT_7141 [Caerostris extrusa]